MEAISASLEQTSPYKLKAAVYGLIIAAISLSLSFVHLALKYYNKHSKSTVSNEGRHKPGHHLGWGFAYALGLIFSILTLSSASLHYYYLSNGKQQPIRFSTLPLVFPVCVFCSCLFPCPIDRCRFHPLIEHGEDKNICESQNISSHTSYACNKTWKTKLYLQGLLAHCLSCNKDSKPPSCFGRLASVTQIAA